jgi:hypothetical protein
MTQTAPVLSDLAAMERLLGKHLADRPLAKAMLNALLAAVETLPPCPEVVAALKRALMDLLTSTAGASTATRFASRLDNLISSALDAASRWSTDNPEHWQRYSIGPRTIALVQHLRNDTGLSDLMIYRHLERHYGYTANMPEEALLRSIIRSRR